MALHDCSDPAAFLIQRLQTYPFMLAPMAGITDAVYRQIARDHGCPLCYSEMVSASALAHHDTKTAQLLTLGDDEPELAVQLFGADPCEFASAARQIYELLADRLALIDINMACPARKVMKKGQGCALMATPDIACACVESTLDALAGKVPVTCKIRSGLTQSETLAPAFAPLLEQAGACAIAVHGRAASQFYSGSSDRSVIAHVAEVCSVPVIASGDMFSPQACIEVMHTCGVAGVFIARGSCGNPWIFERTYTLWQTGCLPAEPDVGERLRELEKHIRRSAARKSRLVNLRPVMCWYIKGIPDAAKWRNRAMSCTSEQDFLYVLDLLRSTCAESGLI